MGTQRGADVYLETHGESVFKRLCHTYTVMILVKGRGPSIPYSPEERRVVRDLEIQFQTNDGRAVRAGEVDLCGALGRSELTGSENAIRRPSSWLSVLVGFIDARPMNISSPAGSLVGLVWCQPLVLLRGYLTSFPTSIATFEVYPWHRPFLRRE